MYTNQKMQLPALYRAGQGGRQKGKKGKNLLAFFAIETPLHTARKQAAGLVRSSAYLRAIL
jgi:hypothetical protein